MMTAIDGQHEGRISILVPLIDELRIFITDKFDGFLLILFDCKMQNILAFLMGRRPL